MGWSDISPTADQRAAIGLGIKLIHDPWNFRRYILFGSQGGLVCDDITVDNPQWRTIKLSSATGVNWSQVISLTTTDGGFGVVSGYGGAWTTGVGWEDTDRSPGGGDNAYRRIVFIYKSFTETPVTSIDVLYDLTKGVDDIDEAAASLYTANITSTLTATNWSALSSGTNKHLTWSGAATIMTDIEMSIWSDRDVSSAAGFTGSVTVKQITIKGTGENPFGGSSSGGSADETFIADIQGSINAQGRFYWLSKRTVGGTDYVYCNRTSNYFSTVGSAQVATYVDGMNYGIQLSSYDANSLYVTAGDPGGADAAVYVSTNGGATFSSAGVSLTTAGGALSVPYNGVASGANTANAGSPPDFMAVTGQSTDTLFSAIDGSSTTVLTGTKNIPHFCLNGSTIGGLSINAMADDATLTTSDDGGLTWTPSGGTVPAGGSVHGINGLPNRTGAMLVFGDQTLAGSDDRGSTYTDFYTGNYATFAASAFSGGGTDLVWAQARLDAYYSTPVTT